MYLVVLHGTDTEGQCHKVQPPPIGGVGGGGGGEHSNYKTWGNAHVLAGQFQNPDSVPKIINDCLSFCPCI